MINRQQYFKELENSFTECLQISRNKSHDYATDKNPFANFELSELIAGVPTEKGIMIRLLDKVSRIGQLLDGKDPAVTDEKLDDTLSDLINYTNILKIYLKQKKSN